MEKLQQIYSQYIQAVGQVYREAKPMDGLFGWGDDPRKDPCHMRFYEDVEQWVQDFLKTAPDPEELFQAVRYILREASLHQGEHCFWFMYAAHGLTRSMIPGLTKEHCNDLRSFYDECYSKRDRMPAQNEVYKLLKKGGRQRSGIL